MPPKALIVCAFIVAEMAILKQLFATGEALKGGVFLSSTLSKWSTWLEYHSDDLIYFRDNYAKTSIYIYTSLCTQYILSKNSFLFRWFLLLLSCIRKLHLPPLCRNVNIMHPFNIVITKYLQYLHKLLDKNIT